MVTDKGLRAELVDEDVVGGMRWRDFRWSLVFLCLRGLRLVHILRAHGAVAGWGRLACITNAAISSLIGSHQCLELNNVSEKLSYLFESIHSSCLVTRVYPFNIRASADGLPCQFVVLSVSVKVLVCKQS